MVLHWAEMIAEPQIDYPDIIVIFPYYIRHCGTDWSGGKNPYWKYKISNRFCFDRGWLPKQDGRGQFLSTGERSAFWGGKLETGHHYIAWKMDEPTEAIFEQFKKENKDLIEHYGMRILCLSRVDGKTKIPENIVSDLKKEENADTKKIRHLNPYCPKCGHPL